MYQGFIILVLVAVAVHWRAFAVNRLALTAAGWLLLHFIHGLSLDHVVGQWKFWKSTLGGFISGMDRSYCDHFLYY